MLGLLFFSVFHRNRTWTTGCLKCVRDHSCAWVYTWGSGTPTLVVCQCRTVYTTPRFELPARVELSALRWQTQSDPVPENGPQVAGRGTNAANLRPISEPQSQSSASLSGVHCQDCVQPVFKDTSLTPRLTVAVYVVHFPTTPIYQQW